MSTVWYWRKLQWQARNIIWKWREICVVGIHSNIWSFASHRTSKNSKLSQWSFNSLHWWSTQKEYYPEVGAVDLCCALNVPGLISTLSSAVHVTGLIKGQSQSRRRTVQEVFTDHAGLTLDCTPICMGIGATITSHPAFAVYIKKSTKDR